MGESWLWDGVTGTAPTGYQVNWARESRYDGSRQRYLERELSASEMTGSNVLSTAEVNTRYDGDMPYWSSDSSGTGTETGFELGLAKVNDLAGTPAAEYYHTDMLGTTRFLTDETGAAVGSAAYTAFGEPVSGSSGRFGYIGAFGYQTATSDTPLDPYLTDMTFQHVGARYYDPTSGRFLQRDPIGLHGGFNVYAYAEGRPTISFDPYGLRAHDTLTGEILNRDDWPKSKPKTGYSIPEMQQQLEEEEVLQAFCYAGLLAIGGWEAYVSKSVIGMALDVAGWLGWTWTYA